MADRLYFFDTTLRDGEQAPGCQLHTIEKIEIARNLEQLGVDIIEAGFPASSPEDYNSVMEISKVVSAPVICALTRAVQSDIDCAVDALQYAHLKRIHTGIGVSDEHIHYKFGSTREEILERAVAAVKYAVGKHIGEVEFYAEDAGRANIEYLSRVVEAVIKAGATIINIPDTTGYCLPHEYGAKINYLMEHVDALSSGRAILSTHCHNDLGMATACTVSGILNGARQVEVTVNGVGERAGNASLEEVAMILKCHRTTIPLIHNINTTRIYSASRIVSSLMNMPVQANKAVVGRNAFSHSSGIHQDGIIKNSQTYEIMDPKDIGMDVNSIVMTARSGRTALNHRLLQLGVKVQPSKLEYLYQAFLELADKKTELNDDEILMLAGADMSATKHVRLERLEVTTGKGVTPVADIRLNVSGQMFDAVSTGNGPLDASIKALKQIIRKTMTLKEMTIQALSKGSDDLCKVHMQVEYDSNLYYGFGSDTDIVTASVEAYIDCINKFRE